MSEVRAPDLSGKGHRRRFDTGELPKGEAVAEWRAWKITPTDEERQKWPAGLALWFLYAPGAHPLWHWHAVFSCALRDFPNVEPAHLHAPGNTHEFIIGALDPKWDPLPWIDKLGEAGWSKYLLTPMNMVHQVSSFTDEQCIELTYKLVRAMCVGHTSPDDDFKTQNITMITATADHMRRGMHMPS